MILEVNNLTKRYGELIALNHFSLQMAEGEILGLLGPNGSGKTTCINCCLSLLAYDQGEIRLFESEMGPARYDLKKRIGIVPQELAFFGELSVQENIDYFCGLYIQNRTQRQQAVKDAIRFVGLEGYEKFIPRKLSGGLKRRLNIACGIAHKPELIFFDEPTVAVDAQSRNFILDGIRELNRQGSSIVYTSHYLDEVEALCERVVIMDKGQNLASGSIDDLIAQTSTAEKIHLHLENKPAHLLEKLKSLPSILEVQEQGQAYLLKFEHNPNNLPSLLNFLSSEKLLYSELYAERPSLNDIFLELTGKDLRD